MAYRDSRQRRPAGFGASGRRTTLGYWVPLVLTVSVATIGIAAWVWSERQGDDEEDEDTGKEHGEKRGDGSSLPPGAPGFPGGPGSQFPDVHGDPEYDENGMIARMQGALRRTPSPQQIFDGASKRITAGMAAAGAVVGGALTSIREEDRDAFDDHSRWSEEAAARGLQGVQPGAGESSVLPTRPPIGMEKKQKSVAIVVSSVSSHDESQDQDSHHASILSYLPEHVDPDTTRVFVLIYAPGLKSRPDGNESPSRPLSSITSSYSNIGHAEAENESRPELSTVEPQPTDDSQSQSPFFKTLYNQAQTLVGKETMIMPFNTLTGHVHILRHLSPDIVYIQESLTGNAGETVHQITQWVRQVLVVVGDDGGRGGLIDSDDESALAEKEEKWWQKDGVTGLGKRIDVVDGVRTGEDWKRRVSGHE
ncbi:hypothetical protein FQN54_001299 [Arachnomyces sp. PD_36]|nr:hypothetical protein FQN54_001299 [Arachnomyces sp. PD_36]